MSILVRYKYTTRNCDVPKYVIEDEVSSLSKAVSLHTRNLWERYQKRSIFRDLLIGDNDNPLYNSSYLSLHTFTIYIIHWLHYTLWVGTSMFKICYRTYSSHNKRKPPNIQIYNLKISSFDGLVLLRILFLHRIELMSKKKKKSH